MTDTTELIRRCVERVDTDKYPWDYYQQKDVDPPHEQFMLDALAAQLVRQVQELTHHYVAVDAGNKVTVYEYGGDWAAIQIPAGEDRTINTLKAIDEFYNDPP